MVGGGAGGAAEAGARGGAGGLGLGAQGGAAGWVGGAGEGVGTAGILPFSARGTHKAGNRNKSRLQHKGSGT